MADSVHRFTAVVLFTVWPCLYPCFVCAWKSIRGAFTCIRRVQFLFERKHSYANVAPLAKLTLRHDWHFVCFTHVDVLRRCDAGAMQALINPALPYSVDAGNNNQKKRGKEEAEGEWTAKARTIADQLRHSALSLIDLRLHNPIVFVIAPWNALVWIMVIVSIVCL